jgi:hypothetical protein
MRLYALADDHPTTMPCNTFKLSGKLSIGDVIQVQTGQGSQWLACERFGWRLITEPANRSGDPLSAATVYQHLADQRAARSGVRRAAP